MKISIKKSFLISAVVVLFVISGYVTFFLIIKHKNEQVSLFSQEIELYTNRENSIRNADKIAEDFKEDIEKLNSYFLTEDNVVSFIETIEDFGQKSDVEIKIGSVDVAQPNSKKSTDSTLTLRVDAKGSWSSVLTFMEYIENTTYSIDLNKVALSSVSSVVPFFGTKDVSISKDTSQWNASFELSVFTIQ